MVRRPIRDIDLDHTRGMVRAAINGELDGVETNPDPIFGLNIPADVPGVPKEILDPRNTWKDGDAYDEQAKKLAALFRENFKQFEAGVSQEVRDAGPRS
jgi:phosphoenolpyruvate carboxykinase (ATP)